MMCLRKWRQERLQSEEKRTRFVEELRAKLHDDEEFELRQLLSRIDALPKDDNQLDFEMTKGAYRTNGIRKWALSVAVAAVVLLMISGLALIAVPKHPKTVWLSMKHKEISIDSGIDFLTYEDLYLDVDQATIPLDSYPKGISRRLALRMSITGNAEGVAFYVEYRVQRQMKMEHDYKIATYDEILDMAHQGYIMGDVFVRR